ncbi:MAG: hypothetical protein Q8P95_03390 [bacterium]|nr:hypothetical protein [bacterium]
MSHLRALLTAFNKQSLTKNIALLTNGAVFLFLSLTIVILVIYTTLQTVLLFDAVLRLQASDIVHDVAYIIVLVKAFRVLLFYLQTQHLSIKYLIEISIIAPAIEIIFASANFSFSMNLLFVVFSLSNLIIYLTYYEKLSLIDQERYDRESIIFRS